MRRRKTLLWTIAFMFVCGLRLVAQPAAGTYILPDARTPVIPGTTIKTGGLSSLYYVGHNEFWDITDRGPNGDSGTAKIFVAPNFTPTLFKLHLNSDGTFDLVDSIRLKAPDGTPTSGLPNPPPYGTNEIARDTNFNLLGTDDFGYDTEGIVRMPDGTFWICEEYAPGLAHVGADGRILRRVRPQATFGGTPDILKKRLINKGFESIAVTPKGKVWAMLQTGMPNGYANTAAANTAAGNSTEMLRLVSFDPATDSAKMYVYLMDSGYAVSGSGGRRQDVKIGDMDAVNDSELVVIEHFHRNAVNVKKIYKINVNGATPITSEVFNVSGVNKSLEELTRAQISSVAGLTPVTKSLVIDLLNPGSGNVVWNDTLDKPEGLAIISPTKIAMGNDNDFRVASTSAGHIFYTAQPSTVTVYDLANSLNLVRIPQVNTDPVNNAVCPSSSATFTADAFAYPAPTMQWQVSTNSGTTYSNIAGATNSSFTISSPTLAMNGNKYRAIFSNSAGRDTTATATLSVTDNVAPVPNVSTLPTITGECSASVTSAPTATDNCRGTITGTTLDPTSYSTQGTHIIHWRYADGNGNVTTQNQRVIVRDDIAPTITVSVSPTLLWPPNHSMQTINATVHVSDNCSATYELTSISCNERIDCDDIQNARYGTADNSFSLRRERNGNGNGRVYTITYTATDIGGNSATASATVTVPHSNGKVVVSSTDAAGEEGLSSKAVPSPFSGETTIGFTMRADGKAMVRIFNIRGELVKTVFNGDTKAGRSAISWDGKDASGASVPSGTYLYVVDANEITESGMVVLQR